MWRATSRATSRHFQHLLRGSGAIVAGVGLSDTALSARPPPQGRLPFALAGTRATVQSSGFPG
jgi:hypothetical protein